MGRDGARESTYQGEAGDLKAQGGSEQQSGATQGGEEGPKGAKAGGAKEIAGICRGGGRGIGGTISDEGDLEPGGTSGDGRL